MADKSSGGPTLTRADRPCPGLPLPCEPTPIYNITDCSPNINMPQARLAWAYRWFATNIPLATACMHAWPEHAGELASWACRRLKISPINDWHGAVPMSMRRLRLARVRRRHATRPRN